MKLIRRRAQKLPGFPKNLSGLCGICSWYLAEALNKLQLGTFEAVNGFYWFQGQNWNHCWVEYLGFDTILDITASQFECPRIYITGKGNPYARCVPFTREVWITWPENQKPGAYYRKWLLRKDLH